MKFSFAVTLIAAAIAPVFAAPAPEADVETLAKRDLTAFVCEGANFSGFCVNFSPTWNQCTAFQAIGVSGYQSWGPGTGTTCLWYTGQGCTGTQSNAVEFPGFTQVPGFWEFNTASFKCWN